MNYLQEEQFPQELTQKLSSNIELNWVLEISIDIRNQPLKACLLLTYTVQFSNFFHEIDNVSSTDYKYYMYFSLPAELRDKK